MSDETTTETDTNTTQSSTQDHIQVNNDDNIPARADSEAPAKGKAGRPVGAKDSEPRTRMSPKQYKKTRKYANFTANKRNKFLRSLEKTGNINTSAAHAGVSRATIYALMGRNQNFKEKVEIARDIATGILEGEAHRRAVEGVEKEKYYKGKVVGVEREYSDGLLTKLLEASDPERYGKKNYNYTEQNINISSDESPKAKLATLLGLDPNDVIEGEYTEED